MNKCDVKICWSTESDVENMRKNYYKTITTAKTKYSKQHDNNEYYLLFSQIEEWSNNKFQNSFIWKSKVYIYTVYILFFLKHLFFFYLLLDIPIISNVTQIEGLV